MGPLDAVDPIACVRAGTTIAALHVKSYTRHRERRFLLLGAAFGLFLVEGLWLVAEMALSWTSSVGTAWVGLNLAVLVSLYLALLR